MTPAVTVWPRVVSVAPMGTLDWPGLVDTARRMAAAGSGPAKRDTAGFLAGVLRPGVRHRRAGSVADLRVLALDFDHLPPEATPRTVAEVFGVHAGFDAMAWTTHSSTPEAPRVRLVVRLTRPVPADGWRPRYLGVVRAGWPDGYAPDPACAEPTRLHILPPAGADLWVGTGGGLDLLAIFPEVPPVPADRAAQARAVLHRAVACPACGRDAWLDARSWPPTLRCNHARSCGYRVTLDVGPA